MSWIVSLPCTRAEAEALSGEIPALDAAPEAPVVVTREIDEDAGTWQLDAYMDDAPGDDLLRLLQSLAPSAKGVAPAVAELPDEDWVTLSQQALPRCGSASWRTASCNRRATAMAAGASAPGSSTANSSPP